ncbi:hypothetical protein NQ314_016210 [Rhamnusium bicolor]|uniref:RNA-directed DNA polymerase n=1 Tax=Rhamnusium bicolor TaxID=1586634 RepID=A0AAV8WWU3_9CUCU|nr:hypothetical protein NQ314_016210 [Rhamnusium bicolor]
MNKICIYYDDTLKTICQKLKQEDCDKELKNTYRIINKRLYRRTADGHNKLVIPKSARFNILRKYHDDIGHIGLRKCDSLIKSKFWFRGMTRFIRKYVHACLDCAYKRDQYGKKEGFLHPIDKPTEIMHTWHVDHLGPYTKSVGGYSYIFMIIDSYSKFLFARPTKTTNSKEVIYLLEDLFSMFGVVKRIISDCGKAFTSKKFKDFALKYQFKHVLTSVASPRSNGQIERYNLTLNAAINASVNDEDEWYSVLPNVVWGINNTINISTGFTPHRLMFGFDQAKHASLEKQNSPVITREKDAKIAKAQMDKQAKKMKRLFDAKRKIAKSYTVGDLVLWRGSNTSTKEVGRKTGLKFGGPYKVTKVKGNDRYEIIALKGMKGYKKYTATVPVDQLREYTGGVVVETESDSDIDSTDELLDLLES